MNQLNGFYSSFGAWLGQVNAPPAARKRFMAALRRATEIELPRRDSEYEVVLRDLTDTADLAVTYRDQLRCVFPDRDDSLAIAVVCPNWGRGWSKISRDDLVADEISWFFHYARQYILRSAQASILAALALVYKRAPDFRGAWLESVTRSYVVAPPNAVVDELVQARRRHVRPDRRTRRSREFQYWASAVNGFDPFVHRAVFQYVRAQKLTASSFEEESVTALDGLASVAAQFASTRLSATIRNRSDLAAVYGLHDRDGKTLERIYNLRCDFGAHPGWSKWWDFGELYEDVIPAFYDTAVRLFNALVQAENAHRVVESDATAWSSWFAQHAVVVYEAVWSHRLR